MKENIYKTYEKKEVPSINYRTSWNIYPKILNKLRMKKDEKILDAGCGSGKLATYLKGFNLYGVDFLEEAIKKAREKGYKKVLKNKIENLDFKDKEFDITFCIEVFQYLINPQKAFDEIFRVTKRLIIITVPNFKLLRIKSFFGGKYKKQYNYCIKYENFTDTKFLRKLVDKPNTKIKIIYLSNKYGLLRSLLGDLFSSEIVGIFKLK